MWPHSEPTHQTKQRHASKYDTRTNSATTYRVIPIPIPPCDPSRALSTIVFYFIEILLRDFITLHNTLRRSAVLLHVLPCDPPSLVDKQACCTTSLSTLILNSAFSAPTHASPSFLHEIQVTEKYGRPIICKNTLLIVCCGGELVKNHRTQRMPNKHKRHLDRVPPPEIKPCRLRTRWGFSSWRLSSETLLSKISHQSYQ